MPEVIVKESSQMCAKIKWAIIPLVLSVNIAISFGETSLPNLISESPGWLVILGYQTYCAEIAIWPLSILSIKLSTYLVCANIVEVQNVKLNMVRKCRIRRFQCSSATI
jgi:hypothetical protein